MEFFVGVGSLVTGVLVGSVIAWIASSVFSDRLAGGPEEMKLRKTMKISLWFIFSGVFMAAFRFERESGLVFRFPGMMHLLLLGALSGFLVVLHRHRESKAGV